MLTKEVYEELEKEINDGKRQKGEYQLTSALDAMIETIGLCAYLLDGKSFDLGLPEAYSLGI